MYLATGQSYQSNRPTNRPAVKRNKNVPTQRKKKRRKTEKQRRKIEKNCKEKEIKSVFRS